jgi:sarcosine oxidase
LTYDAIVLGAGGMGSAALAHLAGRGARVLGLERYTIPHAFGSSHGLTRIIRLAYAEHPDYVPLLRRSYELWRELERSVGERLLFVTGGVDAGPRDGAIVSGSLEACRRHDLPHELLDAAALKRRTPGFHLPPQFVAVYQPDAGFVRAERGVVAHASLARRLGAEIHEQERAVAWEADGGVVRVRTDRQAYTAAALIVTAGPWSSAIAPELQRLATPERQVVLWTSPRSPELFRAGAFPVFYMETDHGRFYGIPSHDASGFKIGKYHHRRERVDPESADRECHPEDEAVLREAIRRYFPDADGPTLEMQACLFTNSPDEHFIIDRHPAAPNVVVAAGFSGHGFKFCPVVGEVLADLALEGGTPHGISLFAWNRPALKL